MINKFTGKHGFLSNFWLAPVEFEGATYPSVEHAYQAAKTLSQEDRSQFWKEFMRPGEAKHRGRALTVRGDWEDIKVDIMHQLVCEKFTLPLLRDMLVATGDQELVEGNYWHDNFWGNCYCRNCQRIQGMNHLGRILMEVRDKLREE